MKTHTERLSTATEFKRLCWNCFRLTLLLLVCWPLAFVAYVGSAVVKYEEKINGKLLKWLNQ